MRILVDADACPVTRIVERIGVKRNIPVTLYADTNHILKSDTSEIRVIGAGSDAVDLALINDMEKGDLVITQDYGVAALALGKGGYALRQDGTEYTERNIDFMLESRAYTKQLVNSGRKKQLKGPKKRNKKDDEAFLKALEKLLEKINR